MSDSEHSTITYTSVPSSVEEYSDIGSPKVDGPLSPDYVPGLKELEQAPLSPNYVPGPEEPEQAPLSLDYSICHPRMMSFQPRSSLVSLLAVDHVLSEEVTKPLPQIPTPPLPIPSPPPDSPTHVEIPESCLPLRKRLRFASPTPSQEVGESSAAGAARQNEPAIARDDPYSLVREELYRFVKRVDVAPGCPMSKELGYENGTKTNYKVNSSHNNPTPETTTSVTNAQLQAMIDQGVTAVLAARDANRNGDDSHTSGTGRPV
nr:hypothetical protein [Tanacetum cinerariifolium]